MTGGGDGTVDDGAVGDGAVDDAVAVLRRGGLVAFPTETVYGLGADASAPDAVARIFAVKGRPTDHPLIVHIAHAELLDDYAVQVPDAARLLAAACWPGPLTIVLRRAARVADAVTGGRPTVGLRVPAHPVALALLSRFGGGVAAPSANRFGRVSPTTAAHVRADLGTDVDLVLPGGPAVVGIESTIVDLSGTRPELLRTGAVTAEALADLLGEPVVLAPGAGPIPVGGVPGAAGAAGVPGAGGASDDGGGGGSGARAPGMLAAHYAPAAEVRLAAVHEAPQAVIAALSGGAGRVGVLAPAVLAGLPPEAIELEPAGDAAHFASVLYDRLRQADRLGLAVLVVVPPPAEGIGAAVLDRLRRAATGSARP